MSEIKSFKVVLIGDTKVGKSSIANRYVNGLFNEESNEHFGAAYSMKRIEYQGNHFRLELWDTVGQERFR